MGDHIMFGFRSLVQEYEITPELVDQLLQQAREEFPAGEMMVRQWCLNIEQLFVVYRCISP